jgi:hypothetical protein
MNYTPVYIIVALVIIGAAVLLAGRSMRQGFAARRERQWQMRRERDAEAWATRNDQPS